METCDAYEPIVNKFDDGDVDKDDTKEEIDLDLEVMNGTGSELVWKHELSLLQEMGFLEETNQDRVLELLERYVSPPYSALSCGASNEEVEGLHSEQLMSVINYLSHQ